MKQIAKRQGGRPPYLRKKMQALLAEKGHSLDEILRDACTKKTPYLHVARMLIKETGQWVDTSTVRYWMMNYPSPVRVRKQPMPEAIYDIDGLP